MNKYYVYVFLREDRYSPYYVGKGKGRRDIAKRYSGVKPPARERIVRIKEGLTEEDAFQLERKLIKFWGRKEQGGILYNLTDGGEGASGRIETEGQKKRRSKLVSEGYNKKTKEEWEVEVIHRINCSAQRKPVVYEGVSYPSTNSAARALMKKYGVSRNTCIRYIKEGRSLDNTKRNKKFYKGNYTGAKYC